MREDFTIDLVAGMSVDRETGASKMGRFAYVYPYKKHRGALVIIRGDTDGEALTGVGFWLNEHFTQSSG